MAIFTIYYTQLVSSAVSVEAETAEQAEQMFNDEGSGGIGEEHESEILHETVVRIVNEQDYQ